MAKKKGKNLQKLLKNKQLAQLQSSAAVPSAVIERTEVLPEIAAKPEQPKLPSGKDRPIAANRLLRGPVSSPIIKTLISTIIIVALLVGLSISATSQDYLSKFGDWLYQSLELNN